MRIGALKPFFTLYLLLSASAWAQTPALLNGNFETGTLTGWTSTGINEGWAGIIREGSCWSYNNTEGLSLSGQFAANIRSSGPAPTDSIGVLTSDPFVAGTSISFSALSENEDGEVARGSNDPVTFEVRLLDTSDNVLLAQILKTNIVSLNRTPAGPCTGEQRDAAFSKYSIDTSSYRGQSVKLQFRQHTNVPQRGFFTLVDDVAVDEAPILTLNVTGCITCREGERVVVRARIANPSAREIQVELKVGGRLPDGTAVSNQHTELTLQPGADRLFTVLDAALPAGVTEGTWTFEGALLEPELGKTFSRDVKAVEIIR
jgi:hypothetical protein